MQHFQENNNVTRNANDAIEVTQYLLLKVPDTSA